MRGFRSVLLGLLIAGAAPGVASAACVSTPGQWTFADPAGDQWFSPAHSDLAALRVELDAACRLTMEVDVHGTLDPEANLVWYDLAPAGRPGIQLYTTLPRADLPGERGQEVRIGRPQAGGIGYRPEPALAVSGLTGWSGTLDTLGITTPGELRVRAAVWEYPIWGSEGGGPTGTGDAMPDEPGTVVIPLAFGEEQPPPPEVPAVVPAPPVTVPDSTPPAVSDLAVRLARSRGARAAGRKAPRAAAGTYRLSEAAAVAFRLQKRGTHGRFVWLGRSSRAAGAAGPNTIRLAGLVRGLRPGVYRLVATARDAAGNRSAARRVSFRVR